LARRLSSRGLALSGGVLGAVLSQQGAAASLPGPLVIATVRAATRVAAGQAAAAGVVPAQVAVLTEGVLKTMLIAKLKTALAVLVGVAVVGMVAGALSYRALAGDQLPAAKEDRPQPAARAQAAKPEPPAQDRFENAPGWSWYNQPPRPRENLGTSMSVADISGRGISTIFETDKDGALVVYLAFATGQAALDYRPVAFDAERKRYPLKATGGGSHHNVRLVRYRLDPTELPAAKAKYLGFEYLTPEGRKVVAARAAGVEVLPFPEVGKACPFVLTTMDGKKVRAGDLRGKVMLLDCWATWCSPCMAKMPALKELFEKHHKDGLEIIGVCFDQDAAKARKALQRLGLTWPQVMVPTDEKTRDLWQEAGDIGALPRLRLIDRDGILRWEGGPHGLEEQVARLLKEEPRKRSAP
jgi:thiol-disulfide isomerase/thioredoxin